MAAAAVPEELQRPAPTFALDDQQTVAGPSAAAPRLGPIQGPLRGSRLQGFVTAVASPAYVSAALAGPGPGPGSQAAAGAPRGVPAPSALATLQPRGAGHQQAAAHTAVSSASPPALADAEAAAVHSPQHSYPVPLASQAAAAGAAVVAALDAFPGRWAPRPSSAALRPTRAHQHREPARWSSPSVAAMAALSGHSAANNSAALQMQPAEVVAAAAEVMRLTGTMFSAAAPAVALMAPLQQQPQQNGRSCGVGMQRRQSLVEPVHARSQQRHRATDGWYPAPTSEAHSKGLPPTPEVSPPPTMLSPSQHSAAPACVQHPGGGASSTALPVTPPPAPELGPSAVRAGKGGGLPLYDDPNPGGASSAALAGASAGGGGAPPTPPRRLLTGSHGMPQPAAASAAAVAAAGSAGEGGSATTSRAAGAPSSGSGAAAAARAGGGRSARAAATSSNGSLTGLAARGGGGLSPRGAAMPSGGSVPAATAPGGGGLSNSRAIATPGGGSATPAPAPGGPTSWLNDGASRLQALAAGSGEGAALPQQGHHTRVLRSSLVAGGQGGAGVGGGGAGGGSGGTVAAFLSMGPARGGNAQRQHGRVH